MKLIDEVGNELEFAVSGNTQPDNVIDISRRTASNGAYRQSVAGERFIITEACVVSGSKLRDTLNFINKNLEQLYYTPDSIPPEMVSGDFPMQVNVDYKGKSERWYNGQIEYVIELDIISTEYL